MSFKYRSLFYNLLFIFSVSVVQTAIAQQDVDSLISIQYERLIGEGKYSDAHKMIDTLITANPNKDSYFLLKATAYLGESKYKECISIIDKAPYKADSKLLYTHLKGAAYFLNKEHEKAIQILQEYVNKHTDGALIYYDLSDFSFKMNEVDKSISYFKEGLAIDVDHDKLSYFCEQLRKNDRISDAYSIMKMAIENETNRNNKLVYAQDLIMYYVDDGRSDLIAHFCNKLINEYPDTDKLKLYRGMAYVTLELYEKALADVSPLVAKYPCDAKVNYIMTNALHSLQRYGEVIAYADEALKCEDLMEDVRTDIKRKLSSSYFMVELYDESEKVVDELLQSSSPDESYFLKLYLSFKKSDFENVVRYSQMILDVADFSYQTKAITTLMKSMAHFGLGEYDKFYESYMEAKNISGEEGEAIKYMFAASKEAKKTQILFKVSDSYEFDYKLLIPKKIYKKINRKYKLDWL
ncbi:hypothetical protein NBRC110019_02800 [Neptunitalea chrysea]|uniref:Tetratricopeptide repeat protein n=1 Tax=Neptunitalea chrysea TaxID=1647581 RepID=A0A9W6B2M7_9FLAO|nr:CDC27 family protein [Neptunitalea chrysea]GLB51241.1 hypothetical protein NBRC110019_02800 [Neptunitalea chrysea]